MNLPSPQATASPALFFSQRMKMIHVGRRYTRTYAGQYTTVHKQACQCRGEYKLSGPSRRVGLYLLPRRPPRPITCTGDKVASSFPRQSLYMYQTKARRIYPYGCQPYKCPANTVRVHRSKSEPSNQRLSSPSCRPLAARSVMCTCSSRSRSEGQSCRISSPRATARKARNSRAEI